jgi:chromate reductase, NAD(P)H dehydrogenase (quinone)
MAGTHLIGISGSLRSGSYNTALLRAAFEHLPEGVSAEIADISDIPLYNADSAEEGARPAAVETLRSLARSADGIVFATPEYNWSVTGAMKNAIDWLSLGPNSPLDFKPAAIIGAGGGSGTARSQQHLRDILSHNSLCIVADPQVMVAGARDRFQGTELADDGVRSELALMVHRLVDVVRRARSIERIDPGGSVLVVGSDETRADAAARSVVEMGHRTLRAIAPVDAVRILSRRAIGGVVIDARLSDDAKRSVRSGAAATAFIEFDDPAKVGRLIDDELRFGVGSG